jgi:type III secretion system HrpE/YscL family protein
MARVIRADNANPRVVPAAVANAHEQARVIVEDARRRAEEIRARAEVETRAAQADALMRVAVARDQELATVREAAVEIAMQAARHLIGEELAQRPELARTIAGQLLSRVQRARSVTLRAHPDDCAVLAAELDALRERAGTSGSLRLHPDPSITRGGCIVHSDVGSLDARVETQLSAIARALERAR